MQDRKETENVHYGEEECGVITNSDAEGIA